MELSRLLIEDMLKIEKNAHTFDIMEVNKMMRNHKYPVKPKDVDSARRCPGARPPLS